MKMTWKKTKMNIPGVLLVPLILLVPFGLVMATPVLSPAGTGPGWDDDSPGGHTDLARRLAADHEVRVLEGSISLLPREAGTGDVLFLFPTHRPAEDLETRRVMDFVERGGLLVVATGGGHGADWTEPLGVRFQGLPVLPAHEDPEPCFHAPLYFTGTHHELCLPNPTSFPNTTHLLTRQDVDYSFVGLSTRDAFIDTNEDGRLSLGDQGPQRVPLVLQWSFGEGQVVAISDGTLWRNNMVREHGGNLDAASVLTEAVGRDGVVYLDSTAAPPRDTMNAITRPLYAGMSLPELYQWTALALAVLGLAGAAFFSNRAALWQPHKPARDAENHEIERQARVLFTQKQSTPPASTTEGTGRPEQSAKTRNPSSARRLGGNHP